jgi:hypothetical protein
MSIPAGFIGRVFRTKLKGWGMDFKKLDQLIKEWPGSELDVLYESASPKVVIVFETSEDCLAFTLKYGKDYV